MSRKDRTSVPLFVSAAEGTMLPCDNEACERWASGKLTVKTNGAAWVVLAAAGCSAVATECGQEPNITRDDRNALFIDVPESNATESPTPEVISQATSQLAQKAISIEWV